MPEEKESWILKARREFEEQPGLVLDETILTARLEHMVTERKLGNLKNTSSSSLKKEDNACVIEPDAFQNCKESASETHLPAEKKFSRGRRWRRGSGVDSKRRESTRQNGVSRTGEDSL